jgi:hypothetical protein
LPLRLHPEDRDNQEKKETYMSKNLTLKGLALGAIFALGTTVIAGAPAHAAVADGPSVIKLAASAGTTLTTLAGATFSIDNTVDQALKSQYGKKPEKIAYQISNPSAASVGVQLTAATHSSNSYIQSTSADAAADLGAYTGSNATTLTSTKKVVTVKAQLNAQTVDTLDAGTNVLKLVTTTDATDNFSVTVTAFVDENGNGQIDAATDYASAPITVNFITPASASVTTSITSAVIGGSAIEGSVVIGGGVNNESLAGQVWIGYKKNGVVLTLDSSADDLSAVYTDGITATTFSTAKAALIGTRTALSAGTITQATYVAQAYFGTVGSYHSSTLGSASNANAPVAGTNLSVDGTDRLAVAASANTKYTAGTASSNGSAGSAKVRTAYAGDIAFSSYVLSTDGTDTSVAANSTKIVATAGLPVRVTLTATNLTGSNTFTAGGKTISATVTSAYFDTTTDATGKVSFTGKSSLGTKDDSVTVAVAALKQGAYATADTNVLTWGDAVVQNPVLTTGVIGSGSTSYIKIAKGTSYGVTFAVADDFGQAWTATGYRLNVAYTTVGSSNAVNAAVALVAGVGSLTIADTSVNTGSYTVTATVEKLNTAGTAWAASSVATGSAVENVLVSSTAAATVTGTVTTSEVGTTAKTFVNADLRVDTNTQSATTIGYGTATSTATTVAGVVTDATGVAVAGQDVTIAGSGLAFVSNDGKVYKTGSITVQTDATGNYTVYVLSATAGKAAIAVTAGAATVAKTITFSGITAMAETNVLSLDVASLSQVGRSVTVTVKLVDKYGNAVTSAADKVAIAVTGVGSLSAKTLTIDKGAATVQFVAGANDFGDAVITAKYTATDAAETVVSATKTLTIGVTDAQVDVVNNRVTAVASFSKGKTVGFYVDGVKKWSKLSASDADVVVNYNLKKGRHTVTVKISGGFVTTEVIVVK